MKTHRYIILFLIISVIMHTGYAQKNINIHGTVSNKNGKPLGLVNISIKGKSTGTTTDLDGKYKITAQVNSESIIIFSSTGYKTKKFKISDYLRSDDTCNINPVMEVAVTRLEKIDVLKEKTREENIVKLNPENFTHLPTATGGGIESLIKTLPGVASNNELSSQYSVRGGNFDENLIYVNDIEIHRPFLVRSGQQEGLSFVNQDLVSSVLFSSGGFSAKYGGKMSSVLDVEYRTPKEFAGGVTLSLLGGSAYFQDISKNKKFTHLSGIRYKTSSYLLNTLETSGDYDPSFTDFQTYMAYSFSSDFEISFLGNIARNQYNFYPNDRKTDFGTINKAMNLYIDFSGKENDIYNSGTAALTGTYMPSNNLKLKFITTGYFSKEQINYDIQGQYSLNLINSQLGESLGDSIMNLGTGNYIRHARNKLTTNVYTVKHTGKYATTSGNFAWGAKFQDKHIQDKIDQWRLLDSAGYSIPYNSEKVTLSQQRQAQNELHNSSLSLYSEYNRTFNINASDLSFRAGFRSSFLEYDNKITFSPRFSLSLKPNWNRDLLFRFSSGWYFQPPFYKEFKKHNGKLVNSLPAQESIHYVFGYDYNFTAWGRPFKFVTEFYYKDMPLLIPYEVNNVKISYFPEKRASGYIAGIDLNINGEFVEGVDSYISLSIMKAMENVHNDGHGYIPRPTDQRVNASVFFQDYLPNNESYKMHLKLMFGSSLPFGPPNAARYKATNRMPAYKRVDVGFSKELFHKDKNTSLFGKIFEELWIKAEIFNLFDIQNTISYNWITVVPNTANTSKSSSYSKYAVPNRLTGRRLNVKIIANF